MTRPEWALTGVVGFALLYAAVWVAIWTWRRRKLDQQEQTRAVMLDALPAEPVDDPCVTEGCGHARGDHYERIDRTRGACLDPECSCAKYTPDRPQPVLLGVVYDHEEDGDGVA